MNRQKRTAIRSEIHSPQLELILEKIKKREISVKNFFSRQNTIIKVKPKSTVSLPVVKRQKTNSKNFLYTSMEMHLANVMPNPRKMTVQKLMKMTSNAKSLVSAENLSYHTEKVLRLVKLKPLEDTVCDEY